MKKFLAAILITLVIQPFCIAYETVNLQMGNDYLLVTEKNIKKTVVSDEKILSASAFFTIMNEKNIIMLHPIKSGLTDINIYTDKFCETLKIRILPKNDECWDETIIRGDFEFIALDTIPNYADSEIDTPPKGGK